MKKALAILMVLAMVTGVAFAQDAPALTFSGAIKTGVQITSGDSAEDGAVIAYNDDAGKISRFDLKGDYTDGDFGVSFRIRADDFVTPKLSFGYVWGNVFSNMVTFKAGNIDDGAWATEGDDGFDVADGLGLQLQVKPIEGVNFGVKLTPGAATPMTTEQFASELAIGGAYVSDLFNFQAGYKLDSDYDDTVAADGTAKIYGYEFTGEEYALAFPDVKPEDWAYAYVGFNVKAIENLTLKAEGKFTSLGAYSDIGLAEINEIVAYAVTDPLAVGIVMYQWIPGNSDAETIMNFKPYVNYKLNDKATAGFAFFYEMNSGYLKDATTMYIKPSLAYAFNSHAKINAFYKYVAKDDTEDTTSDNVVQLDFIWSY
jgi:hypothetical protein